MAEQITSANSSQPTSHLSTTALALLHSSLSESTKASYKRSWMLFQQYCLQGNVSNKLPISEITLCNFIAYLFEQNYSPSSITSMVSAISYVHKIFNIQDHSQSFLVRKIIFGANKSAKAPDYRLPITSSIFVKLVNALQFTIPNFFNRLLLQCLFSVAFHRFFRMGELIAKTSSNHACIIQRKDVSFNGNSSVELILRHSKTMHNTHPITISLSKVSPPQVCPVTTLQLYLSAHKHRNGPLFQFHSGSPVSYQFVSTNLQNTVKFIGLNSQWYKGHSFRIGAATEAAKRGLSQIEIQKLGRWKSDAVQKYIRINSLLC